MKTESEQLFEEICLKQNIICNKINTSKSQTADYIAQISDHKFIAEVKQIDPSKEDRRLLRDFNNGKTISFSSIPGERIRNKIKNAGPQLKANTNGRLPGLLVIYNNLPFALGTHHCPYNIKCGMFGLEALVLSVEDKKSPPKLIDKRFGIKKKMTKGMNTTISALAVIDKNGTMDVYHNHFAKISFEYGIFSTLGNREYILSNKVRGEFQEWQQIVN